LKPEPFLSFHRELLHGGDLRIATLFGLDPHTVAKGRRELLEGNVDRGSVRQGELGRKRVEKKPE